MESAGGVWPSVSSAPHRGGLGAAGCALLSQQDGSGGGLPRGISGMGWGVGNGPGGNRAV